VAVPASNAYRLLLSPIFISFIIILQAPYPPSAWLQTFDAVNKDIICPQSLAAFPDAFETKTMQEDCLIANVFVPDTDKKKLPVVVYIHGGSFQLGHSNLVTPKHLVKSGNIIAVTFNYRLGIHGFLCLGTKSVPGNAGMKDQVALLRWVNKNIASYGGNPEDVTLAGYSAGSASVDLLMLSPTTRGLFHKVIPESGSNLAPYAVQIDPLENAKYYAKVLGFNNVDDLHALEEFYKSASFDKFNADPFLNRTDSSYLFAPCVERHLGGEAFLTENPYSILKHGAYRKLPMLYGFANMEGLFRIPSFDTWKEGMNKNFFDFLPVDLKFDVDEDKQEVARRIKWLYFNEEPVVDESILSYIDYFSDIMFKFPTLRAIKFHAEANHGKVYMYEYSFVDYFSPVIPYTANVTGANHCAQTMAVLDGHNWMDIEEIRLSQDYIKMKVIMRDIWVNFITTG
jgi:carboxylesterase type B